MDFRLQIDDCEEAPPWLSIVNHKSPIGNPSRKDHDMKWRPLCLATGILSLIAGLASFSYGGATWLGASWLAWTLTIFGAAATVLGLVPDQFITIFKIPELRKKIFITLIFLAVYRIGYY